MPRGTENTSRTDPLGRHHSRRTMEILAGYPNACPSLPRFAIPFSVPEQYEQQYPDP
jgi:hypothetical protein